MTCATIGCFNEAARGYVFCKMCYDPQKRLMTRGTMKNSVVVRKDPPDQEALHQEILRLQQEAGKWKSKYDQLEIIYNKLADQWNSFQALSKPDNRNIQRAEGAGEMARKLAEVLLCLAYDTDARPLIAKLLVTLADAQNPAGGQEVEVGGKLVKHRG